MTGLALGIDVGTSGVRICAVDQTGRMVAAASRAMPAPLREGATVSQDPQIWWTAATAALAELLDGIDRGAIRAIAVDGTSGTVLAVDGGGRPLAPARMYNDAAAIEEAKLIAEVAPPTTAAHGASSALGRAIQLQGLPGTARILHQADWIAAQFSGRFDISDENNALKTGYDPVLRRWPPWIERSGMKQTLLPPSSRSAPASTMSLLTRPAASACPPMRVSSPARPMAARHFWPPVPIVLAMGVTSLGSTLTLKLLTESAIFSPTFGIYSHRMGDLWLAGGASNTGGAVLLTFFSVERLKELEAAIEPDRPTGLDYYPLAAPGERFPVNDPALPPRVTPRPAEDRVFLQGLLEGVAAIEALGYRRLAELGATPLRSMRSVGGGAANPAWSRIRQKRLGVPFLPAVSQDAAAGTARLAWRGIGVTGTI